MKIFIRKHDPVTKEVVLTAQLTLKKTVTKERALELAKVELAKAGPDATWELKER